MTAQVIPLQSSRRYVIEREIGQGGMGVVYEARDLERNTRVALKALHHTDGANIYRLKHEFRQLADVSHPNLVSLHELCFDGDKWFFTMELVDGQTFDDHVAASPSPAPPNAPDRSALSTVAGRARILRDASVTLSQTAIGSEFPLPRVTCDLKRLRSALRQLVEAIAALHDAGKLHRDIKPSNVLVTATGRVVVLDFGLVSNSTYVDPDAQDADRSVGGVVFGTPAYMSPEQAAGEPVTTASDWYSIGAMLYESLTGQLPFDGTVLQILKQKDELEPVPASEVVSGVPDDLDQLCRNLLRRDPARRPNSAEILRYLSAVSNQSPVYDASATTTTTINRLSGELFVGREPHLAALREAFERARKRQPATVFVHGYSGMGKSALVRCFANELIKNDEAVVLRGRCYERESVPYKAFDDIIDALSRYLMRLPVEQAAELLPRNIHSLSRLFPVLKRVKAIAQAHVPLHQSNDPLEVRNQAFGALKDLLLRLSDWHPLVINIDDLQWGDMDSARLLSHLLGHPDAPPILFVGAYRREERDTSAFLRHVLGEDARTQIQAPIEELAVDGLAPSEAEQLTRQLLQDLPLATELFTRSIASDSDGVPFFIGELAQHVKGQTNELPGTLDSISLDNVITTRVARMSDDAQRVLEVLSVAARPLEQGMLLEAAGLPTGDRAALLALRAARLIRTRGTRQTDVAETYHDRVRESVALQLSPARTREIHAGIARASEAWGVGEPEQLVVHYSEAGEGMRAGETAIHAAHAAAEKLAFNRAAELYHKALDLLPNSDLLRKRQLTECWGDALANAGRGAQAADVYLDAARDPHESDVRRLKRKAAQQLLRSGRTELGTVLAKELLEEVGLNYPRSKARAIAEYLWNRARLDVTAIARRKGDESPIVPAGTRERLETLGALFQEVGVQDILTGALLQTQFLREAIRTADPRQVLQGLAWEAFHQSMQGTPRSRKNAELALKHAEALVPQVADQSYALGLMRMAQASYSMFALHRFRDALAPIQEAETLFRDQCRGAYWERGWTAMLRFTALEFTGDLKELANEATNLARDATERDDRSSLSLLLLAAPFAHLMRDEPRSARAFLDKNKRELPSGFTTSHYLSMARTVDMHLYVGDATAALAEIDEAWPRFQSSFLSQSRMMIASANYYRGRCTAAYYAQTRDPKARAQAIQHARKTIAVDAGYAGYGNLVLAGIEEADGCTQRSVDLLDTAIAHFDSSQVDHGTLYASYRKNEIFGDAGALEKLRAELMRQGVVNPAKWVAVWIPGTPR